MNLSKFIKNYKEIPLVEQLKHLKFEIKDNECIVSLVDSKEYEIIKGYGKTPIEALNDLHGALL